MNWTAQQRAALDAAARWLKDEGGPQVFRLFGYAGTGKTTLARHLADGADGPVLFAAFTGKAASVMRAAGCEDATTLHSLIYEPKEKSRARLMELQAKLAEDPTNVELARAVVAERERVKRPFFVLNPDSPLRDAALLVVDECSMVGDRLAEDVLGFRTKILVLGDPAQLPPVYGGGAFTSAGPNVMLTEIHRQARDNPIIDMATRVREGGRLDPGRYGDSAVLRREEFDPDSVREEQVIVGRNSTRHRANARMRRNLRGDVGPCPVTRDRLVCLRNNHQAGIYNGSTWDVEWIEISPDGDRGFAGLSDGPIRVTSEMHIAPFRGEEVDPHLLREADLYDYGYALTCHKAQGSQWPSVVVVDESAAFNGASSRWLYTAITRAQEKLTVVRT